MFTKIVCIFLVLNFFEKCNLQSARPKHERDTISFPDEEYGAHSSVQKTYYPTYHPGGVQHYHSEDYDYGGEKTFRPWMRVDEIKDESSRVKIPVDYIQNLNRYNVSDLLLNFIDDDEEDTPLFVQDRFGSTDVDERTFTPKSAACMPELQTVRVAQSEDPTVLFIPQCTRIERCGGCCNHDLLTCQPTHTEAVSLRVYKTQYTGAQKLKKVGKEVVQLERHLKCKCDCKIQSKDCNRYQQYKKDSCQCVCANRDEEQKCYKNDKKIWNPETCACECKRTMPCTTGYNFDQNECKCLPIANRRRYAIYDDYEP